MRSPRRRIPRVAVAILAISAFAVACWLADRSLGQYRWADVLAQLAATPRDALFAALILTIAGYGTLTFYDVIALRYAGVKLGWPVTALASFCAFAVGYTVGFAALSGGSIRLRVYSSAGVSPGQIAQVIAFCEFTSLTGALPLLGGSLLLNSHRASVALHMAEPLVILGGLLAIALIAGYLALNIWRSTPLHVAGRSVPIPGIRLALAQVVVACADQALAAAVLYVLLPAGAVDGFGAFLGLYLVAISVGLLSGVPGGFGVFETVFILLVPGVPAHQLFAALFAGRAIYCLLPFLVALVVLAAREIWLGRRPLARAAAWLRAWVRAAFPQVLAAGVFVCGLVLLFSGATPALGDRLHILRRFVPLSLVEISHLAGSAVGIALLILARGLHRRMDAAWHISVLLLSAGIVASLLKGLDYEEALLLAALLVALVGARGRFDRRATLLDERFSPQWIGAIVLALAATVWLGFFSYRNVEYSNDLWWQFAFRDDAPRMLRAMVLAILVAGSVAAWKLMRPARDHLPLPDTAVLDRARLVIAQSEDTSANLALLGDKKLIFSRDQAGFVMFQPAGRSWVAMGDPIGPACARAELVWAFRAACDRAAARPVFYQVGAENLPLYVDAGFALNKLGEEARVDLPGFDLEGSARAHLRQSHHHAQRQGASFNVLPAALVPAQIETLRAISAEWLAGKATAEKGFSLGHFDAGYLGNFDCATVSVAGRMVAFANLWRTGNHAELSVDLMRHSGDAHHGFMDYLFVEIMLWGKLAGYQWFNLGMAPLSGLQDREFAPLWSRTGALLYRHGEHFYNFEGLRRYKERFTPQWRPRYLASPGGWALPRVLVDVTSLIAGGTRKVLMH